MCFFFNAECLLKKKKLKAAQHNQRQKQRNAIAKTQKYQNNS